MWRFFIMTLAALLAVLCNGGNVQADLLLYGSTGGIAGNLYSINPTTQAVTFIGNMGTGRVGGIDFDSNGVLFASAGGSSGPYALFTINPLTAAATLVGSSTDIQGVDGLRFDRNGTLYGSGWTGSSGAIVTIDTANGAILTTVTASGSGNSFSAGIAFDPLNNAFVSRGNAGGHLEDLDSINVSTGVMTPIGGATQVISDIWFSSGGTLYASSPNGDLFTIDPLTGNKTFLFNTGIAQFSGLTGFETAAVPEPSSMALLGLGVLGLFGYLRRRPNCT